jgi:hypothetical protein
MQREGEQVRRGKPVGQALAATPEVALDVIAVARRTVEAFDLPAGASVRAMSAETSKLVKNVFVEARLPGRAMANSTQAPPLAIAANYRVAPSCQPIRCRCTITCGN